ncbi:MAG TPA: alpha-galactosidase [Candidatus Dormibacteraeota bacterium]|nr:alpha-galactosidase [Candidatus Dormibacteraeota bacterium]
MGGEDARSTRRLARRPLRATSWLVLALLLGAALQPASGALAARPVLRPLRAPTPSPATVPVEARDETPPMGWNSWNAFGPDIDAALIEAEARALVTSGLREAGYDTVVVDGGWGLPGRDAHGDLQPDPAKFPEGIAAVAAYVHRLGLRFGIHQAVGMTDCPGRMPGTQSAPGGELQDASTFAAWGVDFIKYDLCHYRFPPGTTPGAPDLAEIAVERGNALIGRYEAASPTNLLRGGARIGACPRCPGGHDVTGIGLEGGSLQIDGVTAPSPGPYRLVIRYVNVDHSSAPVFLPLRRRRMALLSVDGGPPIPTWYPVPTTPEGLVTGWGTLGSLDVQVRLRAGTNSLTFSDPGSFEEVIRAAYQRMADAIHQTGRPMQLSISEYGIARPWLWGPGLGISWRTTDDVGDFWSGRPHGRGRDGIMTALDEQDGLAAYAFPGAWNDPDMLQIGNGGTTPDEDRAVFSLWAILAAPLMLGNDLLHLTPETERIISNLEVIAVDQDPLGDEGTRILDAPGEQVWARPLADGSRAVVLLDTADHPETLAVTATELGLPRSPSYTVRDLWAHTTASSTGQITTTVPGHGAAMFRVWANPSPPPGPAGRAIAGHGLAVPGPAG